MHGPRTKTVRLQGRAGFLSSKTVPFVLYNTAFPCGAAGAKDRALRGMQHVANLVSATTALLFVVTIFSSIAIEGLQHAPQRAKALRPNEM